MMINVIGMGYIGLPTALMLGACGNAVVGTDRNANLINLLKGGKISHNEPGLKSLFRKAIRNNIEFDMEPINADIYIVAVPTPYNSLNKKINAEYVVDATKSILEVCKSDAIIVIESTVSPGTIHKYLSPLVDKKNEKTLHTVRLAHAPERIIPGKIIYELTHNSRVIGTDDEEIGQRIASLYKTFCKGDMIITSIKTAEMVKVVENTYRDVNIAFANELLKICKEGNLDVYEVIRIANMHPRVNILNPGPGVGGHCISVDPWFLVGDYPGLTNIILTARLINDSMPGFVLKRIHELMVEHNIKSSQKVGLYGITYKENVNDTRESPTLRLLQRMEESLASGIKVFDPMIKEKIVDNQYLEFHRFLDDIDIIVIMVGHEHIIKNRELISNKIVLDTRNALNGINRYLL